MLLKKGDNNEDVKKLQVKLGVDPVGNFGPKTEEAVKKWQAANGLTADGIVGDGTWGKMFGAVAPTPLVTIPPSSFKLDALKGHIPDAVIAQIPDTAAKFNITTPLRLAHFLAQCGHESGGFKSISENLNYSVDGLKRVFGKYFPGDLANSYAKQPEKIASRVYGSRMGNGDESTGEGYKYRGRGYIQLTGKSNYTGFAKFIGEDTVANPDLVATKYPLASAGWFFTRCLPKCTDASDTAITAVTKCVNGGVIGLEDRKKHFNEYYNLLK